MTTWEPEAVRERQLRRAVQRQRAEQWTDAALVGLVAVQVVAWIAAPRSMVGPLWLNVAAAGVFATWCLAMLVAWRRSR